MYLRQRCFDGWVNKSIVKHASLQRRAADTYVRFSRRKIPRSSVYTISDKVIRFRHPDCNPDLAQKLISSSMSRHLSTRNISSKCMNAFLSNLANRQTDKQTRAKTYTSSFVGGNNSKKHYAIIIGSVLQNNETICGSFCFTTTQHCADVPFLELAQNMCQNDFQISAPSTLTSSS